MAPDVCWVKKGVVTIVELGVVAFVLVVELLDFLFFFFEGFLDTVSAELQRVNLNSLNNYTILSFSFPLII